MKIFNLTQHAVTWEQAHNGEVIDLPPVLRADLIRLLTFDKLPSQEEIHERACDIINIAIVVDARAAMIGGAPFLMPELQAALLNAGIDVAYAFSKRETEEVLQEDGSMKKTSVFRHAGFVYVSSDTKES
jgi:hypothetical protein